VRVFVGWAAFFVSCAATQALYAEERAFTVAWQAPSECPDGAAIERYVEQVVGGSGSGPVAVRATGSVTRSADGRYAATLELDTGSAQASTRALDAADCEAVSQAAALLIGLAIRAQVEPVAAPPVEAPQPPVKETPPAAAEPSPRARGFLSVGPVADWGSTPGLTFGLSLSGGVQLAGLRIEPSLAYFGPRSESVAGQPGVGARFTLATAGLRACMPLAGGRLWLAPCLGAGVDWIRGSGFGARVPRSGSSWSAVGRAGLLLGWDISSVISMHWELEGVLAAARPEFQVQENTADEGFVFRRRAASARTGLGMDVHF